MTLELHRPRSILFPVDFSTSAPLAAGCVRLLVSRFQSAITLLHVLSSVVEPFEMLGESMREIRSREQVVQGELSRFAEEHLPGAKSTSLVQQGEPAEVIASVAERSGADLLVMPTRGKGRFRRFLLGSTTAKVLNDVPVPVLTTAHSDDTEQICIPGEVQHILCALALDDKSASTLRFATLVAREYGARLTAVHTLEDRHDRDWAVSKFREIPDSGMPVEFQVETGSPAAAVCRLSREIATDLVVIGRSTPGPLGRLRAQSYDIIRQSRAPVLSV